MSNDAQVWYEAFIRLRRRTWHLTADKLLSDEADSIQAWAEELCKNSYQLTRNPIPKVRGNESDLEKTFGLLVLDRKEATIGLLFGTRFCVVEHYETQAPRKHSKSGVSVLRFERFIESASTEFYTKVGEAASRVFMGIEGLAGILVGGPGPIKVEFLKRKFLHPELMDRCIISTFDVGYTDEYGLRELVEAAQEVTGANRGASQ